MAQPYQAKCGKTQIKPAQATLLRAVERDDNTGFCLACGHEQAGIEPDARRAACEACSAPKVYGAEQLLLMGLHHT